jgi:hypothetical protein
MKSNYKFIISIVLLIITANSCTTSDLVGILSSVTKTKQDTVKENTPNNTPKENNTDNKVQDDNIEKTKIQEVQNNIKIFQTITETYSDIKNGSYPENVTDLYLDALMHNYWKEFKNPYTGSSGVGVGGSYLDMKQYKYYTTQSSLKGLVIYEPLKCTDSQDNCNYKLYGTDKTGALLEKD